MRIPIISIRLGRIIYNCGIFLYGAFIRLAALWHPKARAWIKGRRKWMESLSEIRAQHEKIAVFHAASLGEAEQGLPIIRRFKADFPQYRVVLSFYSPSGYTHFNQAEIDYKIYLPLDTPRNARKFTEILQPEIVIFIKYDIWFNIIRALRRRQIPVILAPALFRQKQWYFKKLMRPFALSELRQIDRILVQNQASRELLAKHGLSPVAVIGDTRVDRVLQIKESPFEDKVFEDFCRKSEKVLIAGSSWAPDENLLQQLHTDFPALGLIIAPHELSSDHLRQLRDKFPRCQFYSQYSESASQNVLIVDNVGMLSKLYRYGHMAFIGGGFGAGLHNTLEAAAYGLPLFFGPNHHHFVEPGQMMEEGFGYEINDYPTLKSAVQNLLQDENLLKSQSAAARQYVIQRSGASEKVVQVMKELLGED